MVCLDGSQHPQLQNKWKSMSLCWGPGSPWVFQGNTSRGTGLGQAAMQVRRAAEGQKTASRTGQERRGLPLRARNCLSIEEWPEAWPLLWDTTLPLRMSTYWRRREPRSTSQRQKRKHDAEQGARYNLHLCQQVCVDTVGLCVYINMQCLGEKSERIQNKLKSGNYPTEGVFTFNLLHWIFPKMSMLYLWHCTKYNKEQN